MRSLILMAFAVSLLIPGIALAQNFTMSIDGPQAGWPSPATGSGTATYNPATKMLSYTIGFSGLLGSETAAHFHGPAAPGVNAGVLHNVGVGNPKVGVVGPLTAAQEGYLLNDMWYINIHSTLYPGGEIRGQVIQAAVPVESESWGKIKALYEAR